MSFAARRGTRLTAHLTVYWKDHAAFREKGWQKLDEQLIRLARAFLERQGIAFVYAYVRENVQGRGPHTHYVIQVPRDRWHKLVPALEQHLYDVFGFSPRESGRPVALKITGNAFGSRGSQNHEQNAGLARYLSKTIHPREIYLDRPMAAYLGIEPKPHAAVHTRRVSSSENIGPAARALAGWHEIRTPEQLRAFLNPSSSTIS